tara:strand:+ start:123 stop:596 length:474 start_codon:yes stop_codon:yes gene_type:complete
MEDKPKKVVKKVVVRMPSNQTSQVVEAKPEKKKVRRVKKGKVEKDEIEKGEGKQIRIPKVETRKVMSETHKEELEISNKVKGTHHVKKKVVPKDKDEKDLEVVYDKHELMKAEQSESDEEKPKKEKKKRVKKERTPEQIEKDKERMAKLRAMKKKKE